ncbi:MAG: hypothetical protein KatS3mg105_1389 [Gemmatales bacterium]|nr:MAG: hypothetical protein KatS3mg105_1389 [Gemmatales bacterium]
MAELPYWKTPLVEGCYMVGQRHAKSLLQCNTYLHTFRSKGGEPFHWCIDPGSQVDYPHIRKHLKELISDLSTIRLFSINHQDPDVVGNLTLLTRENKEMAGLTTEDTWRLVRHLRLQPKKMYFANKIGRNTVKLPTGDRIQVVPTPFCHFRGAVAYYDPERQILFTGDLFAGLNIPGRMQLFGDEEDWPGIAQFHQIYMPNRAAVAFAIRQIQALRPPVKIIAPQHGFLLRGDFMHKVMERLLRLPVGMDLLAKEVDERYIRIYNDIFGELLHLANERLGKEKVFEILFTLPRDHELKRCIRAGKDRFDLVRNGIHALPWAIDVLSQGQPDEFATQLKSLVLERCIKRKAPLPQLGIGIEGTRR